MRIMDLDAIVWIFSLQPIRIRSNSTPAAQDRTAVPSLKFGINPDMHRE